jgi:hypothetical protein
MAEGEVSVYGGFPVSAGIDNVAAALQAGFPDAQVRVHDFGEELGLTLHFWAGRVFFSTLFMDEENLFLFDGGIPGPLEEAIGFVRRLSECLASAGLEPGAAADTGPPVRFLPPLRSHRRPGAAELCVEAITYVCQRGKGR